jgi:AcrR family transcriptional regulator
MSRAEQRDATRQRIVDSAVETFAEHGYGASSTRDIATRAGVTQGLLTYHFASKDDLWRVAADQVFSGLVAALPVREPHSRREENRTDVRAAIRSYVRFAADHPELFHFMVDAGRHDDDRMRWLVDTHLAPFFAGLQALGGPTRGGAVKLAPHAYYALAGAASLIFAVAPECAALTGTDPRSAASVKRHADLIADLFAPE